MNVLYEITSKDPSINGLTFESLEETVNTAEKSTAFSEIWYIGKAIPVKMCQVLPEQSRVQYNYE